MLCLAYTPSFYFACIDPTGACHQTHLQQNAGFPNVLKLQDLTDYTILHSESMATLPFPAQDFL